MLKKSIIILVFVALLPVSAPASDSWTKNQVITQGLYALATAIDAKQTRRAIQSGNFRELNPLMAGRPSNEEINLNLLAVFLTHTLIANYLPSDSRSLFQNVSLIIGVTNISRNHMVGMEINF